MDKEFKEMKGISAKTTAAGLMGTWSDNMDNVLGERAENRRDCECDHKHKQTRLQCRRLNKAVEELRVTKKQLNRAERRKLQFSNI